MSPPRILGQSWLTYQFLDEVVLFQTAVPGFRDEACFLAFGAFPSTQILDANSVD
ncbi:MAG: hypothetical protein GY945_16200 [Rhodobacteraceae bacterium]|nr:hypothetical protein [Paracoccaceae bacterium]